MSAPPGYDAGASMLPESGGAIRAMQGGFSASPYTGGITEQNSLIPDVPATIKNYSGGANGNSNQVAAVGVVAANNAAVNNAAVNSGPVNSAPNGVAANNSVSPNMAAVAANAEPISSSSIPVPVEDIVESPPVSNNEMIAAIGTVASSNLTNNTLSTTPTNGSNVGNMNNVNGNNNSNIRSNVSTTGTNVANMSNVNIVEPTINQNRNKKKEISNNVAAAVISTISTLSEEEADETKTITVFGKEYIVSHPSSQKKDETWDTIMKALGFDVLPSDKQQKLKMMLYEDSTCVEEDLPISTSITCEPMREIIAMISEELLKKGLPDKKGTPISIIFDPEEQVKAISVEGVKITNLSDAKTEPPVEESSSVEIPKKEDAETVKGGLREKKRRTIRKRK